MIGPSKSKQIFIVLSILLFSSFFCQVFGENDNSHKLNTLIPKIQAKIKRYPKILCGVYIKSNKEEGEININGDLAFPAASLIKLPVGIALLREIEDNKISWNDYLVIKKKNIAPGSGILKFNKVGARLKLKDVFELMLIISDNTAFNMIVDKLGGLGATNRKLADLGLEQTLLAEYIGSFSGRNKTSPHDLIKSLEYSFEGEDLSPETKRYLNSVLLQCKNKSLIKRGLKEKTKFAHKTGTIGIAVGDAGVIYKIFGKKIYISVIVKRPFNDLAGKRLIAEVASLAYKEL